MHDKIFGIRASTIACLFYFLCSGLVYSQVTSRMPALKEQTGVDPAGIGLALMCLGIGSIGGFITIGIITKYIQSKYLLKTSCLLFILELGLLTLANNLFWLCACFALSGVAFAWLEVAANTQAINLEIAFKRAYISIMQGGFCLGALLGSIMASAFAFSGLPLAYNFISLLVVTLLLFLLIGQKLIDDQNNPSADPKDDTSNTKRRERIPFFVVFCGLLAMCAYCADGSVAEWGVLLLTTAKGAHEGEAALVYGILSFFMAVTRFSGNMLQKRFGDFKLLFGGTLLAICCELIAINTTSPWVCIAAFAFLGMGVAPVMPIILSHAGHYLGIRPSLAATVVSILAYSGMLVIPPSLGYVANHFGLERAFFIPLGCITFIFCSSFAFRRRKTTENIMATNNKES